MNYINENFEFYLAEYIIDVNDNKVLNIPQTPTDFYKGQFTQQTSKQVSQNSNLTNIVGFSNKIYVLRLNKIIEDIEGKTIIEKTTDKKYKVIISNEISLSVVKQQVIYLTE